MGHTAFSEIIHAESKALVSLKYTRRHRGGVFAEVSGDYSLYYFQVATEAFGTAMKTFSKAITQVPFLDPKIVGREVLRVHAEFHNNRQKDSQCIRFLNTYLTRSDMHNSPRFFDGDYSSLVDHFDGVKPATCPPNPLNPADHDMWVSLRDRVIGWWELHYPQSRRFLAVSGPGEDLKHVLLLCLIPCLAGSVEELHAIVDASFATDGIPPVPHTGPVPRTPRLQLPFSWDSEHVRSVCARITLPQAFHPCLEAVFHPHANTTRVHGASRIMGHTLDRKFFRQHRRFGIITRSIRQRIRYTPCNASRARMAH